jgi:YggT family protein
MFEWQYFVAGVIRLIISLLNIYSIVIIVRVVAGWLGADPYNPIMGFLARMTDPLFDAIRRRLPTAMWNTGLDFSPLIAVLLIQVLTLLLESVRV